MSERLNLFDTPANCVSPRVCGRHGGYPDRCHTCGHERPYTSSTTGAGSTPYIREHIARVDALFERMNRVIGGDNEDKTEKQT